MSIGLQSTPPVCPEYVDVNMLQFRDNVDVQPISREEIRNEQINDNIVGPVYQCVQENKRPSKKEWKTWHKKSKVIMQQFKKLSLEDGMLVRETKSKKQLVLPEKYHDLIFQELHTKMGHLGAEKVEELARQRFYWPFLQADIEHFVREKCSCVADKRPNVPQRAPLVPIKATAPCEMI